MDIPGRKTWRYGIKISRGRFESEHADEIESALHPKAVCQFLDMIDAIANDMGLQVFITSHSYFVIKKLYLIALKRAGKVSCISMNKGQAPRVYDLHDGMPENSIIDTSIRLYEEEIEEVLQCQLLLPNPICSLESINRNRFSS